MTSIDLLMRKLKWINVREAGWLLEVLGAGSHTVAVYGRLPTPEYVTATELWRNPQNESKLAVNKTIRFFGGPHKWRQYYHGNWVMFVIDRLLWVQANQGVGFKWVLEFDAMNPKPLWEQVRVPEQLLVTG